MANNLLPAATTLFLLLLTLTTANADSDLVLDTDGNPLEAGSEYQILRAYGFFGIGRAGRGKVRSCPLYAVQVPTEVVRADPVKFVPANETQKQIHLSSDVKIDSGFSAYCREDGLWRLNLDAYNRRSVIIASGPASVPHALFRIENTEGLLPAYKIMHSPPGPRGQAYLSVFRDGLSWTTLLGLSCDPTQATLFVFKKYKKDVVASI